MRIGMDSIKILIIEDEAILAKVLEEKFKKENFTVKIAKDGEEALKLIKNMDPNIILLDLMLPKIDGFEVLKEVKENSNYNMIPVIIMSNLSEDENIKRGLREGAVDYFVKSDHPVNEIVDKVKSILKH